MDLSPEERKIVFEQEKNKKRRRNEKETRRLNR